jgi:tetratricopeptide (TPR) repeat protein
MSRHWTQDEIRWLRANVGRVDLQSASRSLGIPLVDIEKKVRELQAESPDAAHAARKAPTTHREAARELTHARKVFEKGMEHLHRREMEGAAACFAEIVELHPDERELVDRARTYLAVARNGKKDREKLPRDGAETYHAAVFEKNRGNCAKALELVRSANGQADPDGRLAYLAACCHALTGRPAEAIESLRAAIAASDQNRIQARLEADLVPLRSDPHFDALVGRG